MPKPEKVDRHKCRGKDKEEKYKDLTDLDYWWGLRELAADFETTTGTQYTGAIGGHAKISWAVDVLDRATDLDDKETIAAAIQQSKLETILGPLDMTAPALIGSGKKGAKA